MRARLRAPLKPPQHYGTIASKGLRGMGAPLGFHYAEKHEPLCWPMRKFAAWYEGKDLKHDAFSDQTLYIRYCF